MPKRTPVPTKGPATRRKTAVKKPQASRKVVEESAGTLASEEVSESDERTRIPEKQPDGTRLIRAINARAAILGLKPKEVASAIDMSYSYFVTLANEPHRFAGINRRWIRNIARFLGVNTIMVYQYAGFLEEEDLNVEVTLDRLLDKARDDIERDPLYGVYVPASEIWVTLPMTQRLLVLAMYNEIQDLRVKEAAFQLGSHISDKPSGQN